MDIFEYMYQLDIVKKIINTPHIKVAKTCDDFNIMTIATDFMLNDNTIFVVLPTLYEAQNYYDMLSNIVNDTDVLFFPASELISVSMISSSTDFLYERINTIITLLNENKKIVVTNLIGAIKYELSPKKWLDSIIKIKTNQTYDVDKLVYKLQTIGYEKVYTVIKTGQFAKRGSIIDIFPFNSNVPIRLDFFGDDIETIKEFDYETQRSIREINEANIYPINELIYDEEELKIIINKIYSYMEKYNLSPLEKEMYDKDIFKLENHENVESLTRYIDFFIDGNNTIIDFKENKKIYLVDPIKSKESFSRLHLDLIDYNDRLGGNSLHDLNLFLDFNKLSEKASVYFEGLRSLGEVDLLVNAKKIDPYKGNQHLVINDLVAYSRITTILSIENKERYDRLYDLLDEREILMHKVTDLSRIGRGAINAIDKYLPSFILVDYDFVMINEKTIFESDNKPKKTKYKSIFKNAIKISRYDELQIGDYVVHYDFGIGRYSGITTLELSGIKRDYIKVDYDKNTGLYLPLERIKDLMKYASSDAEDVKLNTIGDATWLRTKNKVRKRIRDISDKLIKLYAERENAKGFVFLNDNEDQEKFESDFEYELTTDQKRALDEIKKDMESTKVMDRLLCGDVGYGKTELALRAAFKAVYSGKQVAVLAPTTILSRQHYITFNERMEKFGIKVELLSRMVDTKRQREIINGIKTGYVDVVIGTHRLLSDEIEFKDLGLLIVDEEQRFGVGHKEKIKQLKVNVDCITLSATPIPRTLQMSLVGIKDLSMIETPPKNRYPIQTYVVERNDRLISEAIIKEIARGGQVFYLYNFTETIEDMKNYLNMLVPEAKIVIVHGKLNKLEIEKRMNDYTAKKYDVLLCTTIIETGIDLPLTNTLIIHDSDRLGLSQMYQIRGRVGRSDKIAYAYLMYEPKKELTEEAEKRLATIKEFNELGSGFKIAMRDLSIRGAGDILGEEQSGFIESVGVDMYTKILDEEIRAKNNENEEISIPEKVENIEFEPIVSRSIDSSYISSDNLKITFHQKISKLSSTYELEELEKEMKDRFGDVSTDLLIYMYERLMDNLARNIGIIKIEKELEKVVFYFDKEKEIDGVFLFKLLKDDDKIRLIKRNGLTSIELLFKNRLVMLIKICDYFTIINDKMNHTR